MQKKRTGGWAEEPEGHAPSAPPAPPSPAAGSKRSAPSIGSERCGGIPRRPGSRGVFAPPPLSPWAARPAQLWEDGAALSGQCAGPRAWSAGGRWGLQAATPTSAPYPGMVGRPAQRSRLCSTAESALVGAVAAASWQVGAGAEGPPSGPHAQPAVVARPGSLSSEAGAAGARQRGQRTVIGRRRAGGSGRDATGSAQPHWWSLGAGRRLRWRDAGLPGGSRTLLVFIP